MFVAISITISIDCSITVLTLIVTLTIELAVLSVFLANKFKYQLLTFSFNPKVNY